MKAGLLGITSVLWLGLLAAACSGQPVKQGPEVLYPGEFVESVDANIDIVKCRGKGVDQDAAIENARKGCLEWMITERMAQSPGERRAYMAQQDQIMAKLDRYIPPLKPGSRAGKGEGVKSRTRNNDGTVNVEINIKVYSKMLHKDLVAMNIVASDEEVMTAAGQKPSLMVVPFPASRGSKFRGLMEGLLSSYLTNRQWEVVSPSGVKDLNSLVNAIGEATGAEEDEVSSIAKAVGADIYILFEAMKNKGEGMGGDEIAYSVRIEARETTTGRMLASEMNTAPARAEWRAGNEARAFEEALRDAMAPVMQTITDYWRKDMAKGRYYQVVFNNAPKKTDMRMNSVLKRACSNVKMLTSSASKVSFKVQCKLDNLELASAIDEGITSKMSGADYEFAVKTRTAIIVDFK